MSQRKMTKNKAWCGENEKHIFAHHQKVYYIYTFFLQIINIKKIVKEVSDECYFNGMHIGSSAGLISPAGSTRRDGMLVRAPSKEAMLFLSWESLDLCLFRALWRI